MSVIAALRRSGDVSFAVHALRTVTAMLVTSPLAHALPPAGADPREAALTLDAFVWHAGWLASGALYAAAGYALIAPWLSVLWIAAMRGVRGRELRQRASSAYPSALALSFACSLALIVAMFAASYALEYTPRVLPPSAAAQDLLFASIAASLCYCALAIVTLHDFGCALLSETPAPLRAVFGHTWRALDAASLFEHACFISAIALTLGTGELLARALSVHVAWLVLPEEQLLMLVATLLRAAWLARASTRVSALSRR